MARRLLSTMDLPGSAGASVFASRSLHSAKDVLCKTELDLVELLDVPSPELFAALDRIHECVCPPYRSVLSLLEERNAKEIGGGHLSTKLQELDDSLNGGIPFGLITELVGAAGVGKTQLCLMLSVWAAMPVASGGLDGHVVYIDTERKFKSGRMMEIAQSQFPEMFDKAETMQKLAQHVLVLHPSSISDLMISLQGLEIMIIEHSVRLVIIDSVAALLQSDHGGEGMAQRQDMLGQQASLLKFLAEAFRIPIVVTNQVRAKSNQGYGQVPSTLSQVNEKASLRHQEEPSEQAMEDGLTAALGMRWAHSVNVRLLLEASSSGARQIKIVKSPMSGLATFPYQVTAKGLELQMSPFDTL